MKLRKAYDPNANSKEARKGRYQIACLGGKPKMQKSPHRIAQYWWQVTTALPFSREAQEYHALRRIWGDHTMTSKGRGYYTWGSEDNMTPGLFQIWSVFPEAIAPVIQAAGIRIIGSLKFVRWAYACEEISDRKKLIPDMVVYFEDDDGPGVVAFEVKRPGVKLEEKDADKLRAYTGLRSMEKFMRRKGVFLLGETRAAVANSIAPNPSVITWESLMKMQQDATGILDAEDAEKVLPWINRAYARYGIGDAQAPSPAHPEGYASAESFASIANQMKNERARSFVWGSEVVEGFLAGREVEPPLEWMMDAPSREIISGKSWQTTEDRKINRWSPDWRPIFERAMP